MKIKKVFIRFCLIFMIAFAAGPLLPSGTQTVYAASAQWVKAGRTWRYKKPDGSYAKGLNKIGRYYYYFDKKGYVKAGWIQNGKRRYYGWTQSGKGKYGRIIAGWFKVDGSYYFFSKSTSAGSRGDMARGWKKFGNYIYDFGPDGKLRIGWRKISGYTYYFDKTAKAGFRGRLYTGLKKINGKLYYFNPAGKPGTIGRMAVNKTVTIGKKTYYFGADGAGSEVKAGSNTAQSDDNVEIKISPSAFISMIAPMAQADMKKSGVLASVTIAQAFVESYYGNSELAVKAHNLFGMKSSLSGNSWASAWNGRTYTKKTKEYDSSRKIYYTITADFRQYNSYAESVADHSAYLTGAKNGSRLRYAGVAGCRDPKKTIQIIKNGGYATAANYVSVIMNVINRYNLTKYDK